VGVVSPNRRPVPITSALPISPAIAAALLLLALADGCARVKPAPIPPPSATPAPLPTATPHAERMSFEATAYSVRGKTASGDHAREGVVAADPKVLPLGTRIRVEGAGAHSGEYTVSDTGRTIKGHEIDIFVPNEADAKRFGRKKVEVEILSRGSGGPAK
jgi:3D (Asp-Asp-Asp) domain-containing protein